MTSTEKSIIAVTCSPGVAPFLSQELTSLGFTVRDVFDCAVEIYGTLTDCMKLNLYLRTAHRVLFRLARFRAKDPDSLYKNAIDIAWENFLDPDGYFSIDRAVDTPTIRDTRFASLKVKDAIVDRMRSVFGRRPNSGNDRSQACVFLQWFGETAALFLDTTGESLCRRGYRVESSEAPIRESLAAALIIASGWHNSGPFFNPMCGGGTIAIEAALIKASIPASMNRKNFAFMHLSTFDKDIWNTLRETARVGIATRESGTTPMIFASDISVRAISAARLNAKAAGVSDMIDFQNSDFKHAPFAQSNGNGVMIMNPPYGERMGSDDGLRELYADISRFTRKGIAGYKQFVFTGNPELAAESGINSDKSAVFYSGPIRCKFLAL